MRRRAPRPRLTALHMARAASAMAAVAMLSACGPALQGPLATAPGAVTSAAGGATAAHALAGPRWLLRRGAQALHTGGLVLADGRPFPARALHGGWTVVFVGFSTCSQTCPATLALLSAWAQQAGASGSPPPRFVFSSIDPLNDSPQRLRSYMAAFDARIAATTGAPSATDAWASALGAGHGAAQASIDHSNSLFVIGPDGRLAGVLLRPASASGLAADLQALQTAWAAAPSHAGR